MDRQRFLKMDGGPDILITTCRRKGEFGVAAADRHGTYHSIGGFTLKGFALEGSHFFDSGVKVGTAKDRERWVNWAAARLPHELPQDHLDTKAEGAPTGCRTDDRAWSVLVVREKPLHPRTKTQRLWFRSREEADAYADSFRRSGKGEAYGFDPDMTPLEGPDDAE